MNEAGILSFSDGGAIRDETHGHDGGDEDDPVLD